MMIVAVVRSAAFAQADPSVVIETAAEAAGCAKLPVPAASGRAVTANDRTSNNPLEKLTDGKLAEGFGAVLINGVTAGAYRMNLGALRSISAVTSWSHNQAGRRGVRTARYKYFKYFEHDPVIEELYDLETDSHERNNLIANPEDAGVLSKLKKKMQELHTKATEE